jgi:hypothetical protein
MAMMPSTAPSPPAAPGAERRQALLADISRLLARARDGRLEMLRQFLQVPGTRVFIPRSSQGPALFSRIVDLDVLYARTERRLLRDAHPMTAHETRTRLERDLCELHVLLVEFCADLALTYDLEPTDPAVLEAVRRKRAEAGAVGG